MRPVFCDNLRSEFGSGAPVIDSAEVKRPPQCGAMRVVRALGACAGVLGVLPRCDSCYIEARALATDVLEPKIPCAYSSQRGDFV